MHTVTVQWQEPNCKCGMPHGCNLLVACTCGYRKTVYDDRYKAEVLQDAHEAGTGHKAVK